jgi:hypothetical protein
VALAAVRLLARKRAGIPVGRCLACAGWSATAVTIVGEDEAEAEACTCGFSPTVIEIEFVDGGLARGGRSRQ